MLSRRSTNQIELGSVVIFLAAHILYEGVFLNIDITRKTVVCVAGLMLIAAVSLFAMKNRLWSQIGYMISSLVAIHVIGEQMDAVPYFLIIYMLLGTIIVIVGEFKVSFSYFCVANAFIAFDITNYYQIITSKSTFEYYLMLVMFGETILFIHMLIVVYISERLRKLRKEIYYYISLRRIKMSFLQICHMKFEHR